MGEGCALLPYLIAYFGVKAIIHLDDSITHGHNNVIMLDGSKILMAVEQFSTGLITIACMC